MSSESDISKYAELLDNIHVNQLIFPGNSETYQFNMNDLQHENTIFTCNNAVIEHYVFRPLKFSLVAKILQIPIYTRQINEERLKALITEVKIHRELSHCINVVDFYGYALYGTKVWVFMELMEASLEDLYKCFHEKLYPESRFSSEIVIPEGVIGVMERMLYKSIESKNGKEYIMELFIEIYLESLNIGKNPLDTNANFNRGNAQYQLGEYNEAITDYIKAIEVKSIDADAYYNRERAQEKLGLYNKVIADYTKVIELNPTFAHAYNNRGIVQTKLGKYNEAIADYTKAIELDPTYANAYYNRGLSQDNVGKYNEAIADYTKASKLKPDNEDAYDNRKRARFELGEYKKEERRNFKSKISSLEELQIRSLDISEFEEIKVIDITHNIVKKYLHKKSQQYVAIKSIIIPLEKDTEKHASKLKKIKKEIELQKNLKYHKNITQLYCYSIQEHSMMLCMEFMDTSLLDFYKRIHKKNKEFLENLLGMITVNILDGLVYLKSQNIIHRDIKPQNVLLNTSGQVKLCDFGTARFLLDSLASTISGTYFYIPPELHDSPDEKYDVRVDIWALGITITETAYGKYPITEKSPDSVSLIHLQKLILSLKSKEFINKCLSQYSDDVKEFVSLCLAKVEERPKYDRLKNTSLYNLYSKLNDQEFISKWVKTTIE